MLFGTIIVEIGFGGAVIISAVLLVIFFAGGFFLQQKKESTPRPWEEEMANDEQLHDLCWVEENGLLTFGVIANQKTDSRHLVLLPTDGRHFAGGQVCKKVWDVAEGKWMLQAWWPKERVDIFG